MYYSHLVVVVVGFVDTLVEVNEADGQATLNVSIISPLPMSDLQIMFSLHVDSMDGSAGRDDILQCCNLHECVRYIYFNVFDIYTSLSDSLLLITR